VPETDAVAEGPEAFGVSEGRHGGVPETRARRHELEGEGRSKATGWSLQRHRSWEMCSVMGLNSRRIRNEYERWISVAAGRQ
jgi:hypothetical protein